MGKRVGPCVYITDLPRTWTKAMWLWFYRLTRISVREQEKASIDMLLFGSSFICYQDNGEPKHIPIQEVFKW